VAAILATVVASATPILTPVGTTKAQSTEQVELHMPTPVVVMTNLNSRSPATSASACMSPITNIPLVVVHDTTAVVECTKAATEAATIPTDIPRTAAAASNPTNIHSPVAGAVIMADRDEALGFARVRHGQRRSILAVARSRTLLADYFVKRVVLRAMVRYTAVEAGQLVHLEGEAGPIRMTASVIGAVADMGMEGIDQVGQERLQW
jgi:hypothetical protein